MDRSSKKKDVVLIDNKGYDLPLVPERIWDGNEAEFTQEHIGKVAASATNSDYEAVKIDTKNFPGNDYYPPVQERSYSGEESNTFEFDYHGRQNKKEEVIANNNVDKRYVVNEEENYIAAVTKNGSFRITGFTLNFVREIRTYYTEDNYDTQYLLEVELMDGGCHQFQVPKDKYATALLSLLKKAMPGAFKSPRYPEAFEEYVADLYNKSIGQLPVVYQVEKSGWWDINNSVKFRLGLDPYYDHCLDPNDIIAEISPCDYRDIICRGLAFLDIGEKGTAICLLFLFAHMAFLRFWFERSGISFHHVLNIVGPSGSLKSSVMEVLANIFETNKVHKTIRLSSTYAAMRDTLLNQRDCFVVLDDLSNGERHNTKKCMENLYSIVRILADNSGEVKKDFSSPDSISGTPIRSVVAMSMEENMQFNRSTELRVLTVTVGLHTFDGKLLDYFQHDPVLLRNYFALFVGYMQQYGKTLEPSFYKEYQAARNHYEKILPDLRRYCDTAAQLELAVSVLERFLRFHEITDSDLVSNLRTAIRSGLTEHAKRSVTAEPTRLFLDALFNSISIGTEDKDCGIANTEADFCNKRRNYIGFLAQGTDETMLWMRFNSAFKLVTGYYRDFGDDFILKEATIKSSLLDKALILKGNNSAYLCKQKGTGKQRENLMVFRFEKIKEYLANERS